MRELIIGDAQFRRYMDVRWGVDLLSRKGSQKATDGALDPYYFWDPANPEKQQFFTHVDHEAIFGKTQTSGSNEPVENVQPAEAMQAEQTVQATQTGEEIVSREIGEIVL